MKMSKGTVKHFGKERKGYGFVTLKDGHNVFMNCDPNEQPTVSFVKFGSAKVKVYKSRDISRNIKDGQLALARGIKGIEKPGISITIKKNIPLYRVDSHHPGQIIREMNGKTDVGKFINGIFLPERS